MILLLFFFFSRVVRSFVHLPSHSHYVWGAQLNIGNGNNRIKRHTMNPINVRGRVMTTNWNVCVWIKCKNVEHSKCLVYSNLIWIFGFRPSSHSSFVIGLFSIFVLCGWATTEWFELIPFLMTFSSFVWLKDWNAQPFWNIQFILWIGHKFKDGDWIATFSKNWKIK